MTNEQNMDPTITSADDPRVTAYALGELDGADAARVEAFLDGDPAAQREVDEIRAFAGVLGDELAGESAPALDDSRRAVLEAALVAGPVAGAAAAQPSRRGAPLLRMIWPLLAAATVLVIVQLGDRGLTTDSAAPGIDAPASSPTADLRRSDEGPAESTKEAGTRSAGKAGRVFRDGALAAADGPGPGVVAGEALAAVETLRDRRDLYARSAPAEAEADDLRRLGYAEGDGEADAGDALAARLGTQSGPVAGAEVLELQGDAVESPGRGRSFAFSPKGAVALDADEDAVVQLEALGYVGAAAGDDVAYVDPLATPEQRAALGLPTDPDGAASLYSVAPHQVSATSVGGELLDDLFDSGVAPAPAASLTVPADDAARLGRVAVGGARGKRGAAALHAGVEAEELTVREAARAHEGVIPEVLGLDLPRNTKYPTANNLQRNRGETYAPIHENEFVVLSARNPMAALSTFGADVDSASYANVRRYLHRNELPPPDAVRLEELVNAFRYDDPAPEGDVPPFAANVSITEAPWAPEHRLVRIGIKGREVERSARPSSNLVFLLDVSGSMSDADKLPLLINSLKLLLRQLDERDTISIVTYASGSHVVLPPTRADQRAVIEGALDGLQADGSTHASAGIQLAYEQATSAFLPEGNNRILLATDGDFNVGLTSDSDLLRMIREKAKSKVFLTVLGFGTGNLKDSKAELLADNGNGQYAYIDSLDEAHRVLVEELTGTLLTIAKDVKLQVEFNPGRVAAYRLLGYENRKMAAQEFRDDAKDAGDIGAGHTVVAYYEVVPAGVVLPGNVTLKYQPAADVTDDAPAAELFESPELLTVNMRWKAPDADVAQEFAVPATDTGALFAEASDDTRFGAAVAMFGMLLRRSEYAGSASMGDVIAWAEAARGDDDDGRRAEFVRLARTAQGLLGVR